VNRNASIFVAGSTGLAGSAIVRNLRAAGYGNLILPNRDRLDLLSQQDVAEFFRQHKPEYVFLAAAKVGGILANNSYPAEFIYSNLMIQTNVIHHAYLNGVKRLLFLGSSCIYPRLAPQPMTEDYLLTGPLEPTNEPYAVAKIAGIKMCEAYNRQYGTEFIAAMPTNLYGPGDNFHPDNSHVLPALIRRFHEAKEQALPRVVVWGSGTPRRELLYVDDMANGCIFLMELPGEQLAAELLSYPKSNFVNLGTGEDISIRELAEMVKEITGYRGDIVFDTSKPDGAPRKLQDVTRVNLLGWQARTDLHDGIEKTYQWYIDNHDKLRS